MEAKKNSRHVMRQTDYFCFDHSVWFCVTLRERVRRNRRVSQL
jgi:hypothetical protein